LLVRGIDPAVWHYRLRRGRQTIGRSRLCDLRIMHTTVSRLHADLRWENEQFTLRDMNSQNGSFVNKKRVAKGVFQIGDALQFGSVVLEVALLPPGTKRREEEISTDQHAAVEQKEPELTAWIRSAELSQAQEQVFRLLVRGLSEKRVAAQLRLSRHTVHTHVKNIYRALGVHSRAELMARFWTEGKRE
jgi:DNA-binding CsgD family transcriptional regulator